MPISGITLKQIKKCLLSLFILSALLLSSSVYAQNNIDKAKGYARESRQYYQRAVSIYRELIAKGEDLNRLHFELGKLYYDYGELESAVVEFKKTNSPEAVKFLALSYYRLGDFTGALSEFGKKEHWDDRSEERRVGKECRSRG